MTLDSRHPEDLIAPRLASLGLGLTLALVGTVAILNPGHSNTALYGWLSENDLAPAMAWLRLVGGLACFLAALTPLYMLRSVCDGVMALVLSTLAAAMVVSVVRDLNAGSSVNFSAPILYGCLCLIFMTTSMLNLKMHMGLTLPLELLTPKPSSEGTLVGT